jgi:thioredoxin 1
MGAATSDVSDDTWETDVEGHQGYVLVDFWAEWCNPCRSLAPVLDALAEDYGSTVKVVKMDIENNQEVPSRFGIRSIPCLILFKDGKQIDQKVGAQNKAQLKNWIDSQMEL